jgi:VanZ family protein
VNRATQSTLARALAPVALMALIFWSSAQTGDSDIPEWGHIVTHFAEYAVLAALWIWALRPLIGDRAWPVAAGIALAYAISDEIHQSFVPGRVSDPLDVVVDSLGIWAALLAAAYARGRASTRSTHSQSSG